MRVLRWIVFGVPITAWLIHLVVIVPELGRRGGDSKFGLAVTFFCLSTIAMLACLVPAAVLLFREKRPSDVLALLLNLTWLYYLKVLSWGPTVGNL